MSKGKSAEIRAHIDHPVIDADGHLQEFTNLLREQVVEEARSLGGATLVERINKTVLTIDEFMQGQWLPMSDDQRRDAWVPCPAWWSMPTQTLDRASSYLPGLLYERLDELGIDFSVLYPSLGLTLPGIADPEIRRLACRVYNAKNAEMYKPYADRLTPVAVIPMHNPDEAIAELDHAVVELGLKAIVVGHVRRPVPKIGREHPELGSFALRLDTFGIDSDYDYDPFWRRCVELKIAVGLHASEQNWGSRRSPSRYAYNHIGGFASACESLAKSIFFGGVTRRFPTLNFAFLEGGAGWACSLLADMVSHWEKRNGQAIKSLDPANLDLSQMADLIKRYGPPDYAGQVEKALDYFRKPQHRPAELDDWSRCGIEKAEDIKSLFVDHFYFGCEADDSLNRWAFSTDSNPFGARLKVIFGSDIGHWDVPDISEVVEEAYEPVEEGLITEADFRDFMFTNPAELYAGMNPDFFKGTRCEDAVDALIRQPILNGER